MSVAANAQSPARAQSAPAPQQQAQKPVPPKACPNLALLDVSNGNFQIPNSQVIWRDPVAALQKSPTEWVMPDDKIVTAPIGYKVEVALAADCPLRYTHASIPPANVSGGDSANVKGWPKRK